MNAIEIKKAVNGLLKQKYPNIKRYGKEVVEGYETPSFFVDILPKATKHETKNFLKGGFTIQITYFPKKLDEIDQIKKVNELKELFGMVLQVGDRYLTVGEIEVDYIGELSNILQVSVEFDYKEKKERELIQEAAQEVIINMGKEQ